jgi:hypothetical protein
MSVRIKTPNSKKLIKAILENKKFGIKTKMLKKQ